MGEVPCPLIYSFIDPHPTIIINESMRREQKSYAAISAMPLVEATSLNLDAPSVGAPILQLPPTASSRLLLHHDLVGLDTFGVCLVDGDLPAVEEEWSVQVV